MKVNNIEIIGNLVAYDGCHKIYILKNDDDIVGALQHGYKLYELEKLEELYNNSCSLRFIQSWDLKENYVRQFENATFTRD